MIRDPEELRDQRRQQRRAAAPAPVQTDQTVIEQTRAQIERERADDPMARPRQWLCRWRSDRHELATIAADEGIEVTEIRAGIDRALRAEGSTLAELEAARRRPAVRLGRGGAAVVERSAGRLRAVS